MDEKLNKITLGEFRRSDKEFRSTLPCNCKNGADFYCFRHDKIGFSKEQLEEIKKFVGLHSDQNNKQDKGKIKKFDGVDIYET